MSATTGLSKFKVSSKDRIKTLRLTRTSLGNHGFGAVRLARFHQEYSLQRQLAAGAYGVTYLATENTSGRTVVVKKPNDVQDVSDFDQLRGKSSPYVVRTFEIFSDGWETYVVMEYCAGGNLFSTVWDLFDREGHVSVAWCAGIFKQVFSGLHYLHEQFQQSHNDLKPENILLEHKPASNLEVPRTMIGDFGCAARVGANNVTVGDPRYRAPETYTTVIFTQISDAWSCGITLYEVLTGLLPFVNHRNISGWKAFQAHDGGRLVQQLLAELNRMTAGEILEADCSAITEPYARELTRQLLQVKPERRIPVRDAMKSPWFSKSQLTEAAERLNPQVCRAHVEKAMGLKLREVLLMLVASKLQGEHLTFYQRAWEQWDENHDGVMDRSEFRRLWTSLEFPGGRKSGIGGMNSDEIFDSVDVDGNGTLDFEEFVAFMFDPKRLTRDVMIMYFRSAFMSLCGASGTVDRQGLEDLFSQDARPLVAKLFEEIDTDKSGSIDFDEFCNYVLRLCEP